MAIVRGASAATPFVGAIQLLRLPRGKKGQIVTHAHTLTDFHQQFK